MAEPLDLNEIAIFSCVAEEASLTRAAKKLGLPKSTVSRKLTALEERLHVRLLLRSPRAIELTDAGRRLQRETGVALAQIAAAAQDVSEVGNALEGTIRVAAPNDFGVAVCGGLIRAFLQRHPAITVELELGDKTVDLLKGGIDLAVRVGTVREPTLVARHVGDVRGHLVASPAYAAANGLPTTPEELVNHPFMTFNAGAKTDWTLRLHGQGGALVDVKGLAGPLCTNSLVVVRDAALQGLGIARLPTYLTSKLEASRQLVRVLPDHWTGERPVHVVHTGKRLLSTRVRLLIDYLIAELKSASR